MSQSHVCRTKGRLAVMVARTGKGRAEASDFQFHRQRRSKLASDWPQPTFLPDLRFINGEVQLRREGCESRLPTAVQDAATIT